MFGSETLEVGIGIVFVFILFSIICTSVREGLESFLKSRAAYMDLGIRELLGDVEGNGLAKQLYNHPLIYGLFPGPYIPTELSAFKSLFALGRDSSGSIRETASDKASRPGTLEARTIKPKIFLRGHNLPTYMPASNFALALMDLAARGTPTKDEENAPMGPTLALDTKTIRANVYKLNNAQIERAILIALDAANEDFDAARKNLEDWFNSSMNRVSGWYKHSSQIIIFGIAFVGAAAANVNTLTIVDYLHHHEAAREAIIAQAGAMDKSPQFKDAVNGKGELDSVFREVNNVSLPLGWSTPEKTHQSLPQWFEENVFKSIFGWLITALAASLGAPFWFDVLNKVMVVRSTMKPNESSPKPKTEKIITS